MIKLAFAATATFGMTVHLISRYFSRKQVEVLDAQVEDLTTQLRKIGKNSSSLEQCIKELSAKLDSEASKNKTLWDQVDYLTSELHTERKWSKQLEEHGKNESSLNAKLANQLQETERQLAKQMRTRELLEQRWCEAKRELKDLSAAYSELQEEYSELQKYGTRIMATV